MCRTENGIPKLSGYVYECTILQLYNNIRISNVWLLFENVNSSAIKLYAHSLYLTFNILLYLWKHCTEKKHKFREKKLILQL